MDKNESRELSREEIILNRALAKWGTDAQVKMLREECLECAIAIGKFNERGGTKEQFDNVIDEIADVGIMFMQMLHVEGWDEKIQERIDFKINRLEKRLDKNEF